MAVVVDLDSIVIVHVLYSSFYVKSHGPRTKKLFLKARSRKKARVDDLDDEASMLFGLLATFLG